MSAVSTVTLVMGKHYARVPGIGRLSTVAQSSEHSLNEYGS